MSKERNFLKWRQTLRFRSSIFTISSAKTETCSQCGALVGELYPRHEKQTKNPAETTGNRYKI